MGTSANSPIFSNLLDSIDTGIIATDRDGATIICNTAARRLMNIDYDGNGQPIDLLIQGTQLLDIINTGKTGKGLRFEYKQRTFTADCNTIVDKDQIIGMAVLFQNITECINRCSEIQALKKANQELERIISSSNDGIAVSDANGILLRVNEAHVRFTELEVGFVVGKKIDTFYEDGYFAFESITKQARLRKQTVTGLQKMKNGKRAIVTSTPILDEGGNVSRIVTNVTDISYISDISDISDIVMFPKQLTLANEVVEGGGGGHSDINQTYMQELRTHGVVTRDPVMIKILKLTQRVAAHDATVLLQGESGVGKEVFAKLVHMWSKRAGPLIKINCNALPGHLFESELFGYARGAFTGSSREGKPGLFELANEGTLFLDEIEDLPIELQGKFLRVLQDGEFIRLGGTKVVKVNVRLVAACNKDLKQMVEEHKFRNDLYYRINVVPIFIPSLRQRPDDISLLLDRYLDEFNRKYNSKKIIAPKEREQLLTYSWPGNVRELINTIERLVATNSEEVVTSEDHITSSCVVFPEILGESEAEIENFSSLKETFEKFEKIILVNTLKKCNSSRLAGRALGISHTAVLKKMKKYGL